MEHEEFPVAGFEFMNESATDEQKKIIIDLSTALCKNQGIEFDPDGEWPEDFTKWDAARMITELTDAINGIESL